MRQSLAVNVVRLARNLIECTPHQFKHFSFLVKRNAIYSIGWNKPFQTHPLAKRFNYKFNSVHSELSCITKADVHVNDLQRFTLVNVRLDKEGNIRLSKPCQNCEHLLSVFSINEVWYSTNNGSFAKL